MRSTSSPLFSRATSALLQKLRRNRGSDNPAGLLLRRQPIATRPLRTLVNTHISLSSSSSCRMASNGSASSGEACRFVLSPSSVLWIRKEDITAWSVDGATDAIVNAANVRMLGGGGVDGAIHRAAGPELLQACLNVPEVRPGVRCPVGESRITSGFRLPVSHVIHTVGPIYDVDDHPEVSLRNCYRSSLRLAKENGFMYIAFPAISCGVFGYPYKEASRIAISTVKEFSNDFKEVHFVMFMDDIYRVWLETAHELL